MKYVNTIRRIITIDNAISRVYDSDKYYDTTYYDDVLNRLEDKRDALVQTLRDYTACNDRNDKTQMGERVRKRKQIRLACKLLGISDYRILR